MAAIGGKNKQLKGNMGGEKTHFCVETHRISSCLNAIAPAIATSKVKSPREQVRFCPFLERENGGFSEMVYKTKGSEKKMNNRKNLSMLVALFLVMMTASSVVRDRKSVV